MAGGHVALWAISTAHRAAETARSATWPPVVSSRSDLKRCASSTNSPKRCVSSRSNPKHANSKSVLKRCAVRLFAASSRSGPKHHVASCCEWRQATAEVKQQRDRCQGMGGLAVVGLSVIALADAAEENQAIMFQAFTKLKSATQLVILLISLWQKLSVDQVAILEATFLPLTQNTQELGWEESVDASISHLLKTCLSKSSKDHALTLFNQLCIPKDTSRLKKHITLLFDRLAKGGRMSLNTDLDFHQPMLLSDLPEDELQEAEIP
ncbi:protein PTHB1 [Protobothrops mucrosquamatus]|uniref:protein PTHB1 n=1 Tax=Protobothrops mucrosquamatus TaxID=103944 RepID=UPI000775B6E5|nr:protein PTHB1 [Protobothrops mucrosquamatus]